MAKVVIYSVIVLLMDVIIGTMKIPIFAGEPLEAPQGPLDYCNNLTSQQHGD